MANRTKLVRTLVAIMAGLTIASGAIARANAQAPVIPLVTTHDYWDHPFESIIRANGSGHELTIRSLRR